MQPPRAFSHICLTKGVPVWGRGGLGLNDTAYYLQRPALAPPGLPVPQWALCHKSWPGLALGQPMNCRSGHYLALCTPQYLRFPFAIGFRHRSPFAKSAQQRSSGWTRGFSLFGSRPAPPPPPLRGTCATSSPTATSTTPVVNDDNNLARHLNQNTPVDHPTIST